MNKGTYGYIKDKKKKQLIYTAIIAVVAIAIFIAGYLLNKNSKNNVFTILAILFALPGAKMLVGFIIVAPYRSMENDKYEKLCKVVPPNATLLADLVITSPEKVMNLDCMVIDDRHVLALLGKEKQDASYIQTFLARTIKNHGFVCEVKLMTDFDKFYLRVKTLNNEKNKSIPDQEEVVSESMEQDADTDEMSEESTDELTYENNQTEIVQMIKTFIV